jgi:hypothetical protein
VHPPLQSEYEKTHTLQIQGFYKNFSGEQFDIDEKLAFGDLEESTALYMSGRCAGEIGCIGQVEPGRGSGYNKYANSIPGSDVKGTGLCPEKALQVWHDIMLRTVLCYYESKVWLKQTLSLSQLEIYWKNI